KYTRRTRIAQSSVLPPITDEPASPLGDDSQGEACPTDSGFKVDQDRANIAKTSTLLSDSTTMVTSLAANEGSMQQKLDELTALCTSLQRQQSEMVFRFEAQELEINSLKAIIKLLEDKDRGVAEQSGDDAPIKEGGWMKGRLQLNESVMIQKRWELELEEQMAREDQRMSEQIARDAEVARIHAEKELKLRSKKQKKDYYMAVIKGHAGWKIKGFKGMSFEQIEVKFNTVWKQIEDFILMGLKEEAERLKRKGLRLEQESVKKLKTSEEVLEENELWVELKRMFEPDIEDYLWTHTQNLMHAPVEWKLYNTCGVHHVSTKDQDIFMLIEKDYPLRKGLAIVMIRYKLQVENYSQMANDLILKIHKIASRRIVRNKIHKAFPLPVMEFLLSEEVPTASEESSHCQKKRDATAEKIALLLKSSSNCQSKSYDSYAKREFPLAVYVPTASGRCSHCQKNGDPTARRMEIPLP
nr:hypothetical protein [Tanacetum cinerariifolium]